LRYQAQASEEVGKLTEEQVAEYNEGFRLFITDGSGKIPAKLLGHVLRSLGLSPSNAEIADYVGEQPAEGRMIEFTEFLGFATRQREKEKNLEEDMKVAFKLLDKSSSGEVSVSDVKALLTSAGEAITPEEFQSLIDEYDVKGPNMKQDEFLRVMLSR